MIVADTNVLSEVIKPSPASQVLGWVRQNTPLFTTAITEAEMLYGIEILAIGKRRDALQKAAADMFEQDFNGRVLPFDSSAAHRFATILSSRRAKGRPITQSGAQIAAIARSLGATLATRNTQDFDGCGIDVVNPWLGG